MIATCYQGIRQICQTHRQRLQWARTVLEEERPLTPEKWATLTPMHLAVCDPFIVRFSKLQDTMGAKLFPAILELSKEPGNLTAFIDRLHRLEKKLVPFLRRRNG